MPAKVSLESAGDHQFDMSHLVRSGAEDLVKLLLEKAGFNQDLWRVRVNKKQPCSGMTTPISVVRHNEWGIYIRMKPGDNNTCHNVTLIVPTGLKPDTVFSKLKVLEKSFNRNWRKTSSMPATVTVVNKIAPKEIVLPELVEISEKVLEISVREPEVKKFDVVGFLKEIDNIKAICLSVHSMRMREYEDTAQFMRAIYDNLSITLTGHQGGSMMRSVVNRGLIAKTYKRSRHVGYALTKGGMDFIKEDLKPIGGLTNLTVVEPSKQDAPKLNYVKLLRNLSTTAKDILTFSVRLQEIQKERATLQERLRIIDKEEKDICEMVSDGEVCDFLDRLHRGKNE